MTDPAIVDGYRIELFAEQEAVSGQDLIDFWIREGAVGDEPTARERLEQVLLVAITVDGDLAGVSSTYLRVNPQLRMPLWHYRAFVGEGHRMTALAAALAVAGPRHLEQRFVSGEDPSGGGIVFEVENEALVRHLQHATWPRTGATFVGLNKRGHQTRVRYFQGALAPPRPHDLRRGL